MEMEHSHGENFFFHMGFQVENWLCEGVSKKEWADFGAGPAF